MNVYAVPPVSPLTVQIVLLDVHVRPPGVDVTGWPNPADRTQWTFFLRNANGTSYVDPVEGGVDCATTAN